MASAVDWSPEETRLVAGTDEGNCEVFQFDGLKRQLSRQVHRARVNSIAWHPDGGRIASAAADHSVRVWDANSGDVLVSFSMASPARFVAWSPDGRKLAAMDMKTNIRIWDSQRGREYVGSDSYLSRREVRAQLQYLEALQSGDWERASDASKQFVFMEGISGILRDYQTAVLEIFTGRTSDASQTCRRIVNRFDDLQDATIQNLAAWACTLMPNALDNYERPLELIRKTLEENPKNRQYVTTHGAILLRSGEFRKAIETFNGALELEEIEEVSNSYIKFLKAITQHHLGQHDAARATLEQANVSAERELASEPHWNRELTIRILQREATQLIAPPVD
jgi:tetratricopeptide (TPR) repeat protein